MRPRSLLTGFLALALLLSQQTVHSSQPHAQPQPVDFVTPDQVELKGFFYRSPRGNNAPVVMLLHALGEDCAKTEWVKLAEALQAKGYAVLRFDFRGHGDSTTVRPGDPLANPALRLSGFWDCPENQVGVRGFDPRRPRRNTIKHEQFTTSYYPMLVNDIAAARAYLEDSADCDASRLILLGAEEGATLGALWLNAECHRYPLVPHPQRFDLSVPDLANPQGERVVAAVWLSISPTLGKRRVNLSRMLYRAGAENGVPMMFLYGDGDSRGRRTAQACERVLKRVKTHSDFTGAAKVPGAANRSGAALLPRQLGTSSAIGQYLGLVLRSDAAQAKGRAAHAADSVWQWQASNGRILQVPATMRGTVLFNNYQAFLY